MQSQPITACSHFETSKRQRPVICNLFLKNLYLDRRSIKYMLLKLKLDVFHHSQTDVLTLINTSVALAASAGQR